MRWAAFIIFLGCFVMVDASLNELLFQAFIYKIKSLVQKPPDLMTFLCGSSILGLGLHHSC